MKPGDTSLGGPDRGFSDTLWESVRRAAHSSPQVRRRGIEELCARYWKPLYGYIRSGWSKTNEDAKDLTQAFFAWLIEGDALQKYAPERGSFRTFLKTLLKHFVLHRDEALGRLKRGGGVAVFPLAEPLEAALPDPAGIDPDQAFDASWRAEIMRRAVAVVRRRLIDAGHEIRFSVFEAYDLGASEGSPTYDALGARFGIKPTDVQNHLVAVREEVRQEIRRELADATSSAEELQEEWNAFLHS